MRSFKPIYVLFILIVMIISTARSQNNFSTSVIRYVDVQDSIVNISPFLPDKIFSKLNTEIFNKIIFDSKQISQGSSVDFTTSNNETRVNLSLTKRLKKTM